MSSILVRPLHNGVLLPAVGYGTWQLPNDDSTTESALGALSVGYHHIDTADCYEVQPALGKAIAKWTPEQRKAQPAVEPFGPFQAVTVEHFRQNFAVPHGHSPDRDIFLTGKIFTPDFKSEEAMRASVERFRTQMGRDADLMLLHWPGHPRVSWYESMPLPENHRVICWKVMEKLYAEKRVRAIGVSNYLFKHLEPLVADILKRQASGDQLAVLPMINQIEASPFMQPDEQTLNFMDLHKIAKTSYSTLGSTADAAVEPAKSKPEVIEIAKRHNKQPSQVILRWALQHGYCVIPRTSKVPHAIENKDIFDFALTEEEMKQIDKLHCGRRVCPDPHDIA